MVYITVKMYELSTIIIYTYKASPEPASECNNQFNWDMLLLGLKKCRVVRGTCMHDYIGTLSQCL